MLPLQGYPVLDLTTVLFGPLASQVLADCGADLIKVEPPEGDALGTTGYARVLNAWRRPYRTTDGYVCALPYTDAHWRRFFDSVGLSALAEDPRFSNPTTRTSNIEAIYAIVGDAMAKRSTQAWLTAFEEIDVPASRVVKLEALPDDEHTVATGSFEKVHDPAMGTVVFPGVPLRFTGQRPPVRMAPRLGEHTVSVFAETPAGSALRGAP